jgi:tellurite resistance protein
VALVIFLIVYFNRVGGIAYQSSVIRRGTSVMDDAHKAAIIQQIRSHDPGFDEQAFYKRVATAFQKIQTAWCAQNLKDVQIFLSDGVMERFALQFDDQRAAGYRDQMTAIQINGIQIAELSCTGVFDEISVRIAAQAADYHVSLVDGKRASGTLEVQPFVEVWSFLRRRCAVTDITKPGLIEGNCPNCGASIEMNQNAQCPYCKALLHSGQYDWVLTEITQGSEWERPSDHPIPGLDMLRQGDDGFAPQTLEDRASVIFWRRASADRIGRIDPLRKVASEEFCSRVAGYLRPPYNYAGDCAVGGVHLLRVIPADDAAPMDRCVVSVRWSGTQMNVDTAGRVSAGSHLLSTSLLILGRKPGIRTDADKSISSAHCPNCGAPESQSTANACSSCGTVLNDGSVNWILLDWLPANNPQAQLLLRDHAQGYRTVRPPTNMKGLLSWAVKVAAADGTLDPREQVLLEQFAAHGGVSPDDLNQLLAAARSGNLATPEPADPAEAREWLTAAAKIALSDGVLDRREMQLLRMLGTRTGLSNIDVDLLLKRVQAQQYSNARGKVPM